LLFSNMFTFWMLNIPIYTLTYQAFQAFSDSTSVPYYKAEVKWKNDRSRSVSSVSSVSKKEQCPPRPPCLRLATAGKSVKTIQSSFSAKRKWQNPKLSTNRLLPGTRKFLSTSAGHSQGYIDPPHSPKRWNRPVHRRP
jgi:hypothetical protein